MESVDLVTLSDGQIQLEPDREQSPSTTADQARWTVQRLATRATLGTIALVAETAGNSWIRTRLTITVDPRADTSTIHAMAQGVVLACRWAFNARGVEVITWLGGMDPTLRAVVHEAGFRVHPTPQRKALDGPQGLEDAWYADLIPADMRQSDTRQSGHRPLTAREHHVLTAMARGRSNAQIAQDLGISENTVKNHVRSILEVLQTPSRTSAVVLAVRTGLVSLQWDSAP